MPTGVLKRWLSEKGFGFITPDDGTSDIFAHIRQKSGGGPEEQVAEGRRVQYEAEFEAAKGKPKATSWFFIDNPPQAAAPADYGAAYGAAAAAYGGMPPQAPSPPPPGASSYGAAQGYGGEYVDQSAYHQQAQAPGAHAPQEAWSASNGSSDAAALASLIGLGGGGAGGGVLPPPPAPGGGGVVVQPPGVGAEAPAAAAPGPEADLAEEVQIPEEFLQQVSSSIEQIRLQSGGDLYIEVPIPQVEPLDGMRTVSVRGPAVSVTFAKCLLNLQVGQLLAAAAA
mmetsp:Transcript_20802/g.30978  ORF Transcript_20802/g.30978 Transcript_20802/m.30978 type:complete len:282 (-) Transcript_20802:44-889(-)|eukprot:CAMPEP_0206450030 /NCGR_PEP_ID=MMETSP0324_2-20121206/18464_1 /ASSEMBLY_ACC=CAM_ASM_000836 /TAXON_ID=2866 /ORGANISM="Crypthecodinium cohnii, Strain Seligo" /LENGTH=281 /DNA_ID=CAMNT_0053919565 /DNA_START=73 /DNA_END=918 /DNA_ORIENTATION=+